MKTNSKIELCFNNIQNIKYDNQNGGAYAYLQFMAYSRDLVRLLRPVTGIERQLELLEGINWLFNESLANSFSHSNKIIFENKMVEVNQIIAAIRVVLSKTNQLEYREQQVFHAQAA